MPSIPSAPAAANPNRVEWLSILQLVFSALAFLGSLVVAALLLVLGMASVFGETVDLASATSILNLGWVSGLAALLSLPSLITSAMRLFASRPFRWPAINGLRLASIFVLLWPLVLAVGIRLPSSNRLAPWLLPPLMVLAIALPIWWLVELARRKLPAGSAQRSWGVLTASLFITMPVVLISEVLVFGVFAIIAIAWLNQRPELAQRLEDMAQNLLLLSSSSPEAIQEALRPFLQNPLAIAGILGLTAVLVPFMEEALKPLAMGLLWSRRPSPAQGFVYGAICGGAFALLESLLNLAGPLEQGWVPLAMGRAGTALLHISATALVGWGLAAAWRGGSPLRMIAAYLLACLFHGIWNTYSVFTGLAFLLTDMPGSLRFLSGPIQSAPLVLMFLAALLLAFLWGANRILRRAVEID